jgi:hypothetical protein
MTALPPFDLVVQDEFYPVTIEVDGELHQFLLDTMAKWHVKSRGKMLRFAMIFCQMYLPDILREYGIEPSRAMLAHQNLAMSGCRTDEQYDLWKTLVFVRDGWKCQVCGSTENITAHHIRSYRHNPCLRTDPANGITLCDPCHKAIPKRKETSS